MAVAGVSKVGVMGVTPLVPLALKKAGLPKMPGEMGMALCGNMNLDASLTPFDCTCCWGWG